MVKMQHAKCDNLKYPRLRNQHCGRLALRLPLLSSVGGDGRPGIFKEAKAGNQVGVQLRRMAGAVCIALMECRSVLEPGSPASAIL
jgi:hypothetical protein